MPEPSSTVPAMVMQALSQGDALERYKQQASPPRLMDPELINQYLGPLSKQGLQVSGASIPPDTDPFGKGPMKGHRMQVTKQGWKPPEGGFPLAGLEDIQGRFAVSPEVAKNPMIMKVLQDYLAAEQQAGPQPPFGIDLAGKQPQIRTMKGSI